MGVARDWDHVHARPRKPILCNDVRPCAFAARQHPVGVLNGWSNPSFRPFEEYRIERLGDMTLYHVIDEDTVRSCRQQWGNESTRKSEPSIRVHGSGGTALEKQEYLSW